MFVDLPKKIIEVKEKGYINSRLEIIVDTPPQWVLDELDKFFKDFKETMESEGYFNNQNKNQKHLAKNQVLFYVYFLKNCYLTSVIFELI